MARKKKRYLDAIPRPASVGIHLFFILFAVLCIFPILLILGISFTDETALTRGGYNVIPSVFSADAYRYVTSGFGALVRAYGVTIFVTVVGTCLSVLVIALFAYPLSRRDFKYKKQFTFLMFVTMVFNGGMVPWYLICTQVLHIQNTIWALILPYVFNGWYVVILRTFFSMNIPAELIEAAKIDGATERMIFFRMVLPLALPGLATIALFQTLAYWNDWWLPLMLTTNDNLQNLQYMLYKILSNIQMLSTMTGDAAGSMAKLPSESARMALCILAIGPVVFCYPFFQKYFVQGLTVGSVKG